MYVIVECLDFSEKGTLFLIKRDVVVVEFSDSIKPFCNASEPYNEVIQAFFEFR